MATFEHNQLKRGDVPKMLPEKGWLAEVATSRLQKGMGGGGRGPLPWLRFRQRYQKKEMRGRETALGF